MFRYKGNTRTFSQNLRLAVFLSFTAGIVNICGVLGLGILTTNVTGHFAYFAQSMEETSIVYALNFFYYILSFLAGSFSSALLTEFYILRGKTKAHHRAVIVEIILLTGAGFGGDFAIRNHVDPAVLACLLLFAMGLQNSLVTSISNAVVRTTHLTGLFTDLGIELAQLFFYKEDRQLTRLKRSIGMRLSIIGFFFLGCLVGGVTYRVIKFETLLIAALTLVTALFYDYFRIRFIQFIRRAGSGIISRKQ